MKAGLVVLLVACAHGALGAWQSGLRARFDMGTEIGTSFFYDVPRTVAEAQSQGWTVTVRPEGPLPQLTMYCPKEKVLCTLYDDTEYVAGLQIGINQEDFSDALYDWRVQGYINWLTDVDGRRKNFWTKQQYFVSEESLKRTTTERLAARDPNKTLQEDAVWVSGFYGDLLKISTNANDIINYTPYTEQNCITWMGLHYYYNMTETTECASDAMFPWFPLVDSGELIGMGFLSFGKMAVREGERNWFEDPAAAVVRAIVPHGPECLYENVVTIGAVTMHLYYINEPWQIMCPSK